MNIFKNYLNILFRLSYTFLVISKKTISRFQRKKIAGIIKATYIFLLFLNTHLFEFCLLKVYLKNLNSRKEFKFSEFE